MTKKKLDNPFINQWMIELDAVIKHEILYYLVDKRAIAEDEFFFDVEPFINLDSVLMEALLTHMDILEEAELKIERGEAEKDLGMADFFSSTGSLEGLNATQRFLDEHDFLLQVIEKTSFAELNSLAQNALHDKYPIARDTVVYLMAKTGRRTLPAYIKSSKLHESFTLEHLGSENDLENIIDFHTEIIADKWSAQKVYKKKPAIVTSNKKFDYIDIEFMKSNNEVRLNCNYKVSKISQLTEEHQSKVFEYCDALVKQQIKDFSNNTIPNKSNMPTPPPEKMLSSRYDGYLPFIMGLYCIKHRAEYEIIEDFEHEKKYDDFHQFIEKKLYGKFKFLQEEFKAWCHAQSHKATEKQSLTIYVSRVLTKRFQANIAKTQSLIDVYEDEYFN